MYNGQKILAIIIARGGSKGIPRKNVRLAGGKPLIAWTIEAAKKSKCIDRLILSSDDAEIRATAEKFGCDVPFERPAELAAENSPTADAIVHALGQVPGYSHFVMLQPTSPFRTAEDIDNGIKQCLDYPSNVCVSITECEKTPLWMYYRGSDNKLEPVIGENKTAPTSRQQTRQAYVLNGALYVARAEWFLRHRTFLTPETLGFVMPRERSLDVDTELDWEIMEALFAKKLQSHRTQ